MRLETRMDDISTKTDSIDRKLDELIALRNKGLGAFWLASTLLGTGIIGFIYTLLTWWKH